MRIVILLALATALAGETGPDPTAVPVELSNDYFAADARAAHLREMLTAANADIDATFSAMTQFCKSAPVVDPKNAKRLVCSPVKP
jgi:hypothetical protein